MKYNFTAIIITNGDAPYHFEYAGTEQVEAETYTEAIEAAQALRGDEYEVTAIMCTGRDTEFHPIVHDASDVDEPPTAEDLDSTPEFPAGEFPGDRERAHADTFWSGYTGPDGDYHMTLRNAE